MWAKCTAINCDLRYYPLHTLGGNFDVVLMDPPWRVRQQRPSERSMFSNSSFSVGYDTMSNEEIRDLNVGCLAKSGFLFMWVINAQMELAFECMRHWGYSYIDRITWIKKRSNRALAVSQGFYFLHSTEVCLIGVKSGVDFIKRVSDDVIFAEVREKSRKPDELYEIVEQMMPGARKIELFARNWNVRPGWLSLGNQIGPQFSSRHEISCDRCHELIVPGSGVARYKSRAHANVDLCAPCFDDDKNSDDSDPYFRLSNDVDSARVAHQYVACDGCGVEPILGLLFACAQCDEPPLDLCETCYDERRTLDALAAAAPRHDNDAHRFDASETAAAGGGLPVHRVRCAGCHAFPIVGYVLACTVCENLFLCEKCYGMQKQVRAHSAQHRLELIVESSPARLFMPGRVLRCDQCRARIEPADTIYRCNSCLLFDLCAHCRANPLPAPPACPFHSLSHTFTRIDAESKNKKQKTKKKKSKAND
jgi:N6-adenosine-specific RNA methylase IME4